MKSNRKNIIGVRALALVAALSVAFASTFAQNNKKRSYDSFGSVELEDNSIFIEEAFNQQMGSIQYISAVRFFERSSTDYSFTGEIPLTDQKHQLSYSLNYMQKLSGQRYASGFGDLSVGYRYQIFDQSDWLMLIPRVSFILPTGNSAQEFGNGAFGMQTNVAITKRVSRKLLFHYNTGATYFLKSDFYQEAGSGKTLAYEKNLLNKNLGASMVWHTLPSLNFLLEYSTSVEQQLTEERKVTTAASHVINPAVRFSILTGNMQLVPALSFPSHYSHGLKSDGFLIYLSIETNYQ